MLQSLRRFLTLCTAQDVRRLWVLLSMVLFTGILEVAGIASILPFLQLAADPDAAADNALLQRIFDLLGLQTQQTKVLTMGWAVIVFLGIANLFTALASWQTQRIAWAVAHHVSVYLASIYAALPYVFFLRRDSGDIIKSVIDDVNRLVDGVVIAGCRLVTQIIVSSMILVLIVVVDPVVALIALSAFFGPYLIMALLRRTYLTELGRERLLANSRRFITFSDLIIGIKAIKSANANEFFVKRFEAPSKVFSLVQPKIHLSAVLPRYVLETIAFGSVVAVIMYLSNRSMSLVSVLPTLTLFTLAGYRLMPAANLAYHAVVQLLSNYPAIDNIYRDVNSQSAVDESDSYSQHTAAVQASVASTNDNKADTHPDEKLERAPEFNESLALQELSFSYGGEEPVEVLDNVSLSIKKGEKLGIVGPSGSGKTTLIDILVGLLQPTRGKLLLDGVAIEPGESHSLSKIIGYVPQDVFLYNDTLARNVAFGEHLIDLQRVKRSCEIAQINETIQKDFSDGFDTEIGDRGSRLSGGQRQRIGLARALYRSPDILVLDEATSALDTVTEKSVMENIHSQLPGLTIIMIAHRLSTVKDCDRLLVLDSGRLVAQGSYTELLINNPLFRELACVN